jgi:MoxR-like ATPase
MEEHHVTLDGTDHELPDPFMVIATQNPLEHHGTYPLPESQMDRFLMRVSLGYPSRDAEKAMIQDRARKSPLDELEPALTPEGLVAARGDVRAVHVDDRLIDYVMSLVESTREHAELALGASPRASLALGRAAQATAYAAGRDFVTPDDVKAMVEPVLAHRLVAREPATDPASGRDQMRALLLELAESTPVPL